MTRATDFAALLTEQANPASAELDTLSTEAMLRLINGEDRTVPDAVAAEIPQITRAVDAIAERFLRGGRLFYTGAGTSGRLGVLDASECPPTFNAPPELFTGIIAGGDGALRKAVEGAEDSTTLGAQELIAAGFRSADDTVVGIAASGRTPYVLGAMEHATSIGALVIGVSCVPGSPVARAAQIAITPATGPEVLTGSTRMKAGTATKLVLNMLSTAVMVRTGYIYGNLMVNVQTTNEKLIDRAERILIAVTGCTRERAHTLLAEAGTLKTAIVMEKLGLSRNDADAKLAAHSGNLRSTLEG